VLKETGTLWVIGSYHNIFRVGTALQDLGFWILNDVVWIKNNPTPNFRGVRFTNAHETLIWCCKEKGASYTFNHHAMKAMNGGKQMRSDWYLPICSGSERLKSKGEKAHPTQKPETLLYQVIQAASKPGDLVLDPFFGTGTTGVIAKRLHRNWIGIEKREDYIKLAEDRIEGTESSPLDPEVFDVTDPRWKQPRIPFSHLVADGLLQPGQRLYFQGKRSKKAIVLSDGSIKRNGSKGSIHQIGRELLEGKPCNGWELWFFEDDQNGLQPIDVLRQQLREEMGG
jgi:modification methylase